MSFNWSTSLRLDPFLNTTFKKISVLVFFFSFYKLRAFKIFFSPPNFCKKKKTSEFFLYIYKINKRILELLPEIVRPDTQYAGHLHTMRVSNILSTGSNLISLIIHSLKRWIHITQGGGELISKRIKNSENE